MQYPWLRRTVRNQKTHSCSKFQCSIYEMSMLKLLRLKILKLVVLLRAEIFMRRVIWFDYLNNDYWLLYWLIFGELLEIDDWHWYNCHDDRRQNSFHFREFGSIDGRKRIVVERETINGDSAIGTRLCIVLLRIIISQHIIVLSSIIIEQIV